MCKCLEEVNEKLFKMGFELEGIYKGFAVTFSKDIAHTKTEMCVTARELSKGKGRKRKTKSMLINFCPFCGKNLGG